ncbi:adenosine receptor A3-like [Diadema antillarum]|uniref:adenosine receptor A3-like n=1 Tax=Diadema antillarum TaxID=105358 RepID=UPI003A8C5ECE
MPNRKSATAQKGKFRATDEETHVEQSLTAWPKTSGWATASNGSMKYGSPAGQSSDDLQRDSLQTSDLESPDPVLMHTIREQVDTALNETDTHDGLVESIVAATRDKAIKNTSVMEKSMLNSTIEFIEGENDSSIVEEKTITPAGKASFEVPFFITMLLFGGVGNLIVVAVYGQKKFRNSNAALHILSLAAGDIFLLVFVVGLHISEYYRVTWFILWRTDAQCILHRFARFIGFNVTIFEMMAIAIDRYLAVCFPLKFKVHCSPEKTKVKIVILWILALIAAIPVVPNFATKYSVSSFDVNFAGKTPFACRVILDFPDWYLDFKIIYVSTVLFYVPIIITAIIYVIIVVYVRRNNQKFAKISNKDVNRLRSHWKTARTLLAAFALYAGCYVLLATYSLVQTYSPAAVTPTIKNLGLLIPYANSCMNPVIYSIVNPRFRRDFRALFFSATASKGKNKKTARSDKDNSAGTQLTGERLDMSNQSMSKTNLNNCSVSEAPKTDVTSAASGHDNPSFVVDEDGDETKNQPV